MKIKTTRFGELEVNEDLIIKMTKPILGFENLTHYIIVETEDYLPFKWYQSIDDPDTAFVIINPLYFFHDYVVEVNPKEIEELKLKDENDIVTYVIVAIPHDYTKMTANLQGPLLINSKTKLAKQHVLVNTNYQIKHKIFDNIENQVMAEEEQKVPVGA